MSATVDLKHEPPRAAGPTESELLARFRTGDGDAFEEIVRRHRTPVYAVALRMLRRHEAADEAAQTTFVKAWRALHRFRGEAALRTWLIRIAINVSRSMLGRRPAPEALEDAPEPSDPASPADSLVRRGQQRHRVRRAVARLPPRQKEVVMLKIFSEMTHAEVAQALEISEGTAKAHLHQAVANLRRYLGEEGS